MFLHQSLFYYVFAIIKHHTQTRGKITRMLDLAGLLSLTSRPNFGVIDLPVLQEFYHKHLHPYSFEFTLDSGEKIVLKFDLEKFCHLVATAKAAGQQRRMNYVRLREYKGIRGWNNILDGTLTKESIRNLGVSLDVMKDKMIHFYYLRRLLDNGSLMIKYVPNPSSGLTCEFFIYDLHSADNAYIQIGLQKEDHGKWYYPETLLANRITLANPSNKQAASPSAVVSIVARDRYLRHESRKIVVKRRIRERTSRYTKRKSRGA